MKRILSLLLVLSFLISSIAIVEAKEIEVEDQVLLVAEDELVELSAQKKFEDLIMIMKELVQAKAESKVELEEIKISNFELLPQERFKIYYNLD
ncbi:hypothetical protein [Halanaerobacter jeridensis]|uniref:Uncharacterized protein n=1 Tax=Halanaerobacter jeridensis TaxID=706427 RepID=A0A938XSZ4_9FIRM|nr:hypothetical protein [Halanaerobacter jeridensis]MBM7556953.1 hypothetical protein [Halanaerobacter jeridensis]